MRISDWSSDVCSSDLDAPHRRPDGGWNGHSHAADFDRDSGGISGLAAVPVAETERCVRGRKPARLRNPLNVRRVSMTKNTLAIAAALTLLGGAANAQSNPRPGPAAHPGGLAIQKTPSPGILTPGTIPPGH